MNMSNLAWIDLETTGLDPDVHDIIEIGIIITDRELNEVARESWSISATPYPVAMGRVWSREALEMHLASGLVDELVLGTTIEAAAADARRFIDRSGAAGSPMCGASVHFDRAFLRRRAPSLHDVFHYRNFDVSSLRMAAELAGLEVPERKRGLHRALPDLEDSIALALACLDRFRGSQLLARRCMDLDERVDSLEGAIKAGGAAYRAARISLGAPAVELDAESRWAHLEELARGARARGTGVDLEDAMESAEKADPRGPSRWGARGTARGWARTSRVGTQVLR
jgi:oligoribonuclease